MSEFVRLAQDELRHLRAERQRLADALVLAEMRAHKHQHEHPALAEIADGLGKVLEGEG
jgi:hypothetical protein